MAEARTEEKYGQKIKPLIYAMEDRKLRDKKSLCSDEHGRHRPFRLDGEGHGFRVLASIAFGRPNAAC